MVPRTSATATGTEPSDIARTLAIFFISSAGRIVALLFVIFCSTSLWAVDPSARISQYAHTAWRIQDGVFSGAPNAIAQTLDGYVWVGTQNGIVRYDGVHFVPWAPRDGKQLSGGVYSLLAGRDGSLWIGTGTNLARLKDGNLTNYLDALGRINSIMEDRNGTIWIARSRVHDAAGPICEVDGTKLRCHGGADGIKPPYASSIVEDSGSTFWIGSSSGLTRWRSGSSTTYAPSGLKTVEGLSGAGTLAVAPDGLWVGMTQAGPGLGLQQFVHGVWKSFTTPDLNASTLRVSALLLDRENALWIGTTDRGIYRIYKGSVSRFSSPDGLSTDSVASFYEDRESNLWVATTGGIDCFRDTRMVSFSTREGLSANQVYSVLASQDGTIWVGNSGALDFLHSGSVSSIRHGKGLPGNDVTSLLEDHAGRLWVGVDNGLFVYEEHKFRAVRRHDGTPIGPVIALIEDRDFNIWAEAVNPRRLVELKDFKIRGELSPPQIPAAASLAADPQDGIWLGLENGNLAHYRHGQLEIIPDTHSHSSGVRQVLVTSDGAVLEATSEGLSEWRKGTLRTLTVREGLPCENLYGLVSDAEGALWIYAQCGLLQVSSRELQEWWAHPNHVVSAHVFDVFDGAQPARAPFQPHASRSPDGRLWFANETALQTIDPAHLAGNPITPPVHVEEVIADHKIYLPAGRVAIPSLTREVEIDYTALSFVAPQKVRFRYMLEGHDAGWQEPGTRRQAFYNDLGPGHYRFRVIACNNDGVWNEAGASLDFSILPTYYQTAWFRTICAAVFLLLLWIAYQFRVRQLHRQFAIGMEARVNERTRIAQDLHDTLLQGFISASMQLGVADSQLPADWPAKPIVTDVLNLMRDVIEEGRKAVRGMRLSSEDSDDLEQAFLRIPQELVVQRSVGFRVLVEGQVRPLHPLIRDEVYRIGREALVNAFRHSQAASIEVELEYSERELRVLVRDNGCGIDPQVLQSGREGHWGLSGMRERAGRIGARLKVWSDAAAGTEVELSVPSRFAYRLDASVRGLRWFAGFGRRKGGDLAERPGNKR